MTDGPCGCALEADNGPIVVAHGHARSRGLCDHHGCRIERGEPIVKVDTGKRGRQTAGGNGQGEWWCLDCALADANE